MPDTSPIELHDSWLRVRLADGAADFHYRWLRHNSDNDRHPKTGERTLCSSELPDDLRATAASIAGDALSVTFSDGSTSSYPLAWLAEEAYARGQAPIARPPSNAADYTIDPPATLAGVVSACIQRVQRDGFIVVRGGKGPLAGSPEAVTEPLIAEFEKAGLPIVETHFGRIEDLRPDNTTNKNTDQLGYTNSAVNLHTDQPFIDKPPRYQLLQSIIPAADGGGENFVVDALAAARYLAATDAHDYELLTTVPVRFHRKQKAFNSLVIAPILQVEGPLANPTKFQVRYSYFTMAPHQVPFAKMTDWYRAYDRFARLCRDERNQLRVGLAAGDFLLYDNHRFMHARTGFAGSRWVRGIYFDPQSKAA